MRTLYILSCSYKKAKLAILLNTNIKLRDKPAILLTLIVRQEIVSTYCTYMLYTVKIKASYSNKSSTNSNLL